MNRISTATISIFMALSCLSTTAQAEVLTIDGITPASSPEFVQIQSISIERFGGSDGRALAFVLEDRLAAITVYDQPYFDIVAGRSAVQSDATLSGNVIAGVEQYDTVARRRRCVQREEKDKCVIYKDIDVDCLTRTIDFRAQVRATRYRDGRSIYTQAFPDRNEQTVCFGDDEEFASSESVIRTMVSGVASAIRNDLAPIEYRQDIRILESRKGMTKAQGRYFKAAIKMTKSNPAEACRMWEDAAQNGLVHISLAFNRGLCAEQNGDLDSALAHYDEAESLSLGKFEVNQSIARTSAHQRALDDWELHKSLPSVDQR